MNAQTRLYLSNSFPSEILEEIDSYIIEEYRRESAKKCADAVKRDLKVLLAPSCNENTKTPDTYKIIGRLVLEYNDNFDNDAFETFLSAKYYDCQLVRVTTYEKEDISDMNIEPDRRYTTGNNLHVAEWNIENSEFCATAMGEICEGDEDAEREIMQRVYEKRGWMDRFEEEFEARYYF